MASHLLARPAFARNQLLLALVAFVAFNTGCGQFIAGKPKQGVHLDSLEGIPTGASDINYWYGKINRYADFKVSKEQFDAWVKEQGFEMGVDPWTGQPYGTNHLKSIHWMNFQAGHSDSLRVSNDDVWIEKRGKNGGGYTVAYIIKTGRAYYDWSSH